MNSSCFRSCLLPLTARLLDLLNQLIEFFWYRLESQIFLVDLLEDLLRSLIALSLLVHIADDIKAFVIAKLPA